MYLYLFLYLEEHARAGERKEKNMRLYHSEMVKEKVQ